MTAHALEQLTSEERHSREKKEQYDQVQVQSKLFLETFDQSVSQERRLLSEINDLFSTSDDRHFFQEQQQRHMTDSRQVMAQLDENIHDLKRQSSRLSDKIDGLTRERDQLEKSDT